MNSISMMIGLGIIGIILIITLISLSKKHIGMKVLIVFALVGLFILIGRSSLDNQQDCKWLLNKTTEINIYGNNFSAYHWDGYNGTSEAPSQADREAFLFHKNITNEWSYYCHDNGKNTSTSFYIWLIRFLYALGIYVGCYSMYTFFVKKLLVRFKIIKGDKQ